eukprot:TRINITY_DN6136_c0_g1_i1.p1 TRINITY_DN6136_c0_g1~~TRINITY_DN6136_c0_g1_i1.p1  ORF type:complete len:604 (-),score=82.74 TRINITY_DN6136_c0_g1_i1:123-1697(-)
MEKAHADLVEAEVRKLRCERILCCSAKLCFGFGFCFLLFVFFFLVVSDRSDRSSDNIEAFAQNEFEKGHLFSLILLVAGSLCIHTWPSQVGLRIVDVAHGSLMGRLIFALVVVKKADIDFLRTVHACIRLAACVITGNVNVSVLLNVTYFLVACCMPSITIVDNTFAYSWIDTDRADHRHAVQETVILILIIVCICAIQDGTFAQAKAVVEVKVAASNESTIRSLLFVLCDAVVRVGPAPDLRILEASPHLSALLLRSPVQHFVERSFSDLVDEIDRERLLDHFGDDSATQLARLLHVKMVDGDGSRVPVQLFGATFVDLCGNHGTLVGVREVRAEERDVSDCPPVTSLGESSTRTFPSVPFANMSRPNDERTGRIIAGSSSRGSETVGSQELGPSEELVVYFDCCDPQFRMLRWNQNFSSTVSGWCKGQSLLSVIRNTKQFTDVVQSNVNAAVHCTQTSKQFEIGLVSLQSGRRSGIDVQCLATCSVDIPNIPSFLFDACTGDADDDLERSDQPASDEETSLY